MITFHGLGFWGLFTGLSGLALLRLLPRDSAAHRILRRALLAAAAIVAAIVALSY